MGGGLASRRSFCGRVLLMAVATMGAGSVARSAPGRLKTSASSVQISGLPSGRTTYRRLPDYSSDLALLANGNPNIVRQITLPLPSYEGRAIAGLEITTNPNARDGKPVFLLLGLHDARDWPAGEHAMEWAFELVNGYNAGDLRVQRLVGSTRRS